MSVEGKKLFAHVNHAVELKTVISKHLGDGTYVYVHCRSCGENILGGYDAEIKNDKKENEELCESKK